MKLIPLTQGQHAIVDDADYEWLNQWKWYAHWEPSSNAFYAVRNKPKVGGKNVGTIRMHRAILGLPDEDPREPDHVNPPTTLDNRRSNLRIATSAQNKYNRRVYKSNRTGTKGVTFVRSRGKWCARIQVNERRIWLGYFSTSDEAVNAYGQSAIKLHGEFARTT